VECHRETFRAIVDKMPANTMIDTAEAYGFGKSEELIAQFRKATGRTPIVATKFAPLPWRFTSGSVVSALEVPTFFTCKYWEGET
jgi:aryl-alcohol dehydrogenase-like predicted oxidoreductase